MKRVLRASCLCFGLFSTILMRGCRGPFNAMCTRRECHRRRDSHPTRNMEEYANASIFAFSFVAGGHCRKRTSLPTNARQGTFKTTRQLPLFETTWCFCSVGDDIVSSRANDDDSLTWEVLRWVCPRMIDVLGGCVVVILWYHPWMVSLCFRSLVECILLAHGRRTTLTRHNHSVEMSQNGKELVEAKSGNLCSEFYWMRRRR